MRDRTKANLISIAGMFIFFLLTPIIAHADQTSPSSPTPTPTSLEIQRATVGIQGRVLSNNNYDVLIPIDTYYRVSFNTTGGTIINDQFIKKGSYAKEPKSPTRANYEFNYWTLNTNKSSHEQSEKFNFSTTPITSNITLVAVWTPSSPSPSDENKPNNDKEDTNSEEDNKDSGENTEDKEDTTEDKENSSDTKDENNGEESTDNSSETKENSSEDNGEDSETNDENSEDNNGLNDTTEETTETTEESSDGLINTNTNPSSNHSKTSSKSSTPSIETDPDIATNTENTDLLSEIKATVLGVFKTISKSITIVAKISLIGILIWFIWFVVLLNNTLVKIQSPSEDQNDNDSEPDQSQRQSQRQSKSWKTVYLTPIKKTIEQTDGDKRTVWSLSLPQNLLDDNDELKVKIPWSVYHRAEDENQANQTELHITITSDQPEPMMIYIITNETKEIKIK